MGEPNLDLNLLNSIKHFLHRNRLLTSGWWAYARKPVCALTSILLYS